MPVRLRLPELLKSRGLTTYALTKECEGVMSRSMIYRIVASRGEFRCLSPEQIDTLCTVLKCTPAELILRR